MKRLILISLALLFVNTLIAQYTVSGTVLDKQDLPIIGASIFIEDTYDGDVSDIDGNFSFSTSEEGVVKVIASYLGYESKSIEIAAKDANSLRIVMRESAMSLDAVEISASTFKAGDNSKVSVLKPLDIVTTAGSMGDVIAAMQTLPGTQANSEDGRLLVRGGEARETQIYIDGLKVFSPYTRSVGGTPSRGRYSPFLFKGVSFSTGGYSAAFGQALSGILDMNTIDDPKSTETNISLMTVGVGLGHTQNWGNQSLSFSSSYIDLSPYNELIKSRANWIDPYSSLSGEAVYRYKTKNGLFKSYLAGDVASFSLETSNLDTQEDELIAIRNANIYSNSSYRGIWSDKTSVFAGVSIGFNIDQLEATEDIEVQNDLSGVNGRFSLKTIINDHNIINYGIDVIHQTDLLNKRFLSEELEDEVGRELYGAFIESDYFFSKDLAIKTGLRFEHNTFFKETTFDPRITIAKKLSKNGQVSFAAGRFTQEVDIRFLFGSENLIQEKANHFLFNYNFKTKKQILRLEAYYKQYDRLLTFDEDGQSFLELANDGDGRAYGLDLFWRANQMIKNVDFWVSYSWLNHKRKYREFPIEATPTFSTDHNLSLVSKIWFEKLQSQLGLTYRMASGRPYENPNTEGFLNERAKVFNNVSLSWAYLISQQKILFISVSNLPRFKNEFGYEYGNTLNGQGQYNSRLIRPNDDQFFFVGFFITMSPDKMKNQLDTL